MLKVFNMARKRRKFTDEYKAEVVKLVKESGKTLKDVCRDLDLVPSAVSAWVKQHDVDAGRGPAGALTTAERQELSQLRKEVRELRREKEFLGKAAAFFASQKQQGTRS
jgi:transposase-like protein